MDGYQLKTVILILRVHYQILLLKNPLSQMVE
jgi:hypothetical protein